MVRCGMELWMAFLLNNSSFLLVIPELRGLRLPVSCLRGRLERQKYFAFGDWELRGWAQQPRGVCSTHHLKIAFYAGSRVYLLLLLPKSCCHLIYMYMYSLHSPLSYLQVAHTVHHIELLHRHGLWRTGLLRRDVSIMLYPLVFCKRGVILGQT